MKTNDERDIRFENVISRLVEVMTSADSERANEAGEALKMIYIQGLGMEQLNARRGE